VRVQEGLLDEAPVASAREAGPLAFMGRCIRRDRLESKHRLSVQAFGLVSL
jgi:hypothetical protein